MNTVTNAVAPARAPRPEIPDAASLTRRVVDLVPGLWDGAAEMDGRGRLDEASHAGLAASGVLAMGLASATGRPRITVSQMIDATTTLGRGYPSAAWIAGVYACGGATALLFDARDEFLDSAAPTSALVLGRPVAGVENVADGIRVTGEWPYASGCLHAGWFCGLVLRPTAEGGKVPYLALLPMNDLSVEPTWDVVGMSGTGSETVVARDVHVPEGRLLRYDPVLRGDAAASWSVATPYARSFTGLLMIGLLGAQIGAAQAALSYVLDAAAHRPVAGSTLGTMEQSPPFRMLVARAASSIDEAELVAQRLAAGIDGHADAGTNASDFERARARMDATRVGELAREALDTLLTAYGTSAFREGCPLQRLWRDVNVGSRHAGFGMGVPHLTYGTALAGQDPRSISALV